MGSIRIIHTHDPGYGWSFTSPDLPGLVGGDVSYLAAQRRAEAAGRFAVECEAEEQGRSPADLSALVFEHVARERQAASA
jgi:hypothetical protein